MSATPSYNGRQEAILCLAKARKLIAEDDSIRHACLELRLCIEHVVFDELQIYLKETPDEALRKWTPREVISELLTVGDNAEDTATYTFRREDADGEPTGPSRPMGIDRRLSMRWANRSHNALGSFLHAPTLAQLEEGGGFDPLAARKKAVDIIGYLDDLLSGPAFRANFGTFINMNCIRCNRPIRRRSSKIADKVLRCPNRDCGALYNVVEEGGGNFICRVRQVPFVCPCSETQYLDEHALKEEATFGCSTCGRRYELVLQARMTFEPDAAQEQV